MLIRLIGVLIVVVGLILKFDTIATVVLAGIVTGLVGGMSIMDILTTLGNSFVSQRTATLFVLTLPAIGICERYGLKEKAIDFIRSIKSATAGRVIIVYEAIRTLASAFSIRLGGHPQFVRPVVVPMAEGAAVAKYGEINDEMQDIIRGLDHKGRGLILGSGWDKELAAEINADFLSIACPTPYRIVLTTNYVGYTGGLRVIEDIYNTALATYK